MNNTGYLCKEHADEKLQEFQKRDTPNYQVGDFVKTTFETGDGNIEHMWVKVQVVGEDSLIGILNNTPVFPVAHLTHGTKVEVDKIQVSEYLPGEN